MMFFYGKTDKGRQRVINQDNFLTMRLCDNVLLFVLCDGMGGTNGGHIASKLAVSSFAEYVEETVSRFIDSDSDICNIESLAPIELLHEAVSRANQAVFRRSRENSELSNMGTTLVGALVCNDVLYTVNIGDSRLYMFSDTKIKQLTHDHSYVQMLVDMQRITKEEAQTNPRRNILTRALGTESRVEADIASIVLPSEKAYYLLCSDGLYNFLPEEKLLQTVTENADCEDDDHEKELQIKTDSLINRANDGGGGDNITAILIKYLPNEVNA